jgi:hypothetical protein
VRDIDHLDFLIHCAGVSAVASVADTDPATWQDTLTVNVTAAAELTRLLLPALRRSRGHVIFVNASPGIRAVPRWEAFMGSKAACFFRGGKADGLPSCCSVLRTYLLRCQKATHVEVAVVVEKDFTAVFELDFA